MDALKAEKSRLELSVQTVKKFGEKQLFSTNISFSDGYNLIKAQDLRLQEMNEALSSCEILIQELHEKSMAAKLAMDNLWLNEICTLEGQPTVSFAVAKKLHVQLKIDDPICSSDDDICEGEDLQFVMTYMITSAVWQPDYDIHISAAGSAQRVYGMSLSYFARIEQATGEDWLGAHLQLSTAQVTRMRPFTAPATQAVHFLQTEPIFSPTMQPSSLPTSGPSGQPSRTPSAQPTAQPTSLPTIPEPMKVTMADSKSTGDLGYSHIFRIPHRVNISSTNQSTATQVHRLILHKIEMDAQIFSSAVPSSHQGAFLSAWAVHDKHASAAPLLACAEARVFVQGSYVGKTDMKAVQPNGLLQLSLGQDKNVQVTSKSIVPENRGVEEDKSSWFVKDTRRYHVRTEERVMSATSLHSSGDVLVLLSENLPKSSESEIVVELLSPLPSRVITQINTSSSSSGGSLDSYEDVVRHVLQLEKTHSAVSVSATAGSPHTHAHSQLHVYHCRATGNLLWVKWLAPGEVLKTSFKYKITVPKDRQIQVE